MGSNPIQVASLFLGYAFVAQLVEQRTENPRVVGSIPTEGTICGFSSSGRAPPCQGGGSEFEPRNPLQLRRHSQVVRQRSAKPLFPSSSLGVASIRTDSIGISPFFCLKAKKHSVLIRGAFPFLSFFIKIGLRKNDARGKSWYNMVVSKEKFF